MGAFKDWLTGLTSKATPVDADETYLRDSAASGASKKLTWANIKATLKTYFDTLYANTASAFGSSTLNIGAARANAVDFFDRTISDAIGVFSVRATTSNYPTAFDIQPNGAASGSALKAWMHVLNSDLSRTDQTNWQACLVGVTADTCYIGADFGGTGGRLNTTFGGAQIRFYSDALGKSGTTYYGRLDSGGLYIGPNSDSSPAARIHADGQLTLTARANLPLGTLATPSLQFGTSNMGMYSRTTGSLNIGAPGSWLAEFVSGEGLRLGRTQISWGNTVGGFDTAIVGESAGVIGIRGSSPSVGGSISLIELASDPAAPSANDCRLYTKDNGSGKTQLCVRFATGAVQVLATEP